MISLDSERDRKTCWGEKMIIEENIENESGEDEEIDWKQRIQMKWKNSTSHHLIEGQQESSDLNTDKLRRCSTQNLCGRNQW